ncbi:MAG: RNA 2',3'-cyclic phosphodiesterase [Candidatus Nitrosocosmicus sp.]
MRLFIAIDTNDTNIENFQNLLIKKFDFNPQLIRAINRNNLHLTIKFLGEKTDIEVKDIIFDLKKINFTSFRMIFNNVGVFPHIKSPRIIWLGLDDESNRKLNDLYIQINDVLKKYDVGKDGNTLSKSNLQKFFPHLTIFRIYKYTKIPNFFPLFSKRVISEGEVDIIRLKKSTLTPNGSIYSDLFSIHANNKNE